MTPGDASGSFLLLEDELLVRTGTARVFCDGVVGRLKSFPITMQCLQ